MKSIVVVLVVAVVVVALMMAGLGIKMLMRKSHEFKRPCTNADPHTGKCTNCTCKKKDLRSAWQKNMEGIQIG